jgi:putative PIN family toxin of toxin-antitoxin system
MNEVLKVVLDTNILVSSLWTVDGNAASITKLLPQIVKPYYNAQILSEYADVVCRPKFSFSFEKREALLSKIKDIGVEYLPDKSEEVLVDEDDRIIYDTAKGSGSILITGNTKHYPSESFVMTPTEFLATFKNE